MGTAAGTKMYADLGARDSSWSVCIALLTEVVFLLWPRGMDFVPFFPKYVVGAFGLLMAISWLDSSLCSGWRSLSRLEYLIVVLTLLWSAIIGLVSSIAFCLGCALILLV